MKYEAGAQERAVAYRIMHAFGVRRSAFGAFGATAIADGEWGEDAANERLGFALSPDARTPNGER